MFKVEYQNGDIISFGDFRLLKAQRRLERNGIAVALGGRALDILIVLTSRAGELVTKIELMSAVWPNVTIDEGVMRVQLSTIRRVLGDTPEGRRYIVNVAGRGYCFTAPVIYLRTPTAPIRNEDIPRLRDAIPSLSHNVIGREETVTEISRQLTKSRFVSITGTGGIGKTTVAISVSHSVSKLFADGVHFIDFARLTDARFVIDALVSAFRLTAISGDPLAGVISFLHDKQLLLVLDSCEHIIEAAASLAERIFDCAPGVHLLVTSREPLRVLGEQLYRLHSLESPPDVNDLEVKSALKFPAVQLFVDRAQESSERFKFTEADVASVAEICRRLDGIPLAIQLAASRVDAFGVQGTAALLHKALRLFSSGLRTAMPRHQTLGATLDWSYNLLSEAERLILRRLSVFIGHFTIAAAYDVGGGDDVSEDEVIGAIAELVAKSLLVADISSKQANYRILDTTRAYALKKLSETPEKDKVVRCHALYYLKLIANQRGTPTVPLTSDDTAFFQINLPNIRAALDWSLSANGDKNIGIRLGASSAIFFCERALLLESLSRSERLIAAIDDATSGSQHEMLLQMLWSNCLRGVLGYVDDSRLGFERSIEIAERLEDWQFQLRMLNELHLFYLAKSDFPIALKYAQKALSITMLIDNAEAEEQANTMLGNVYSNTGDYLLARKHYEAALSRIDAPGKTDQIYFDFREQTIALIGVSRALWCLGFPDQSLYMANRAIEHSRSTGQQDPVVLAISVLTPSFILMGDTITAEKCTNELLMIGKRSANKLHVDLGNGLKGILNIQRGDVEKGCSMVQECLDTLNLYSLSAWIDPYVCYLAEGLLAQARFSDAYALIDGAVRLNIGKSQLFMIPEMLRIKANVLSAMSNTNFGAAESCYFHSMKMAEEQSALSWALRTAIDLAQLYRSSARSDEALRLLSACYKRFTEGFQTADLRRARQLLGILRHSSSA